MSSNDCIFCKIVKGEIPSERIYESEQIYGFMDIQPLSDGHCLFIPKEHAEKLHETDEVALAEILVAIKDVALALDLDQYNILQNNGSMAHQAVGHTHFHLIPKPSSDKGLKIIWNTIEGNNQADIAKDIRSKLNQ